jgi:hypothetical protein
VMTAAKEAMVKTAVEEVVVVTAAADTVAVERPNRFSGGGPDVVRTNTRGAPDMKPDPKAVGKRLSAMTWSGGSSPPPHPGSAFTVLGGMPRIYYRFFLFSSHSSPRFSDPCLNDPR